MKLILPGKKKKTIRDASNDSNEGNGPKLKIKTNRKVSKFLIDSVKKKEEEIKNSTIVPKRNDNALAKANTIKDRRLKSQEDIEKAKKNEVKPVANTGNATPSSKPLASVKHISRVTGLNRS